MNTQKIINISAMLAIFIALTTTIAYILDRDRPLGEGVKKASEYGGDFTLVTDKGQVSLSDMKGKVVVIYFGFMNCTEACPLSMAKMRKVAQRLKPEELKNFQGVFLTVDPARDNPEDLNAFVRNYHESFIAFTGSQSEIDKVLDQYGIYFKPEDLNGESATYTVDHASRFYMIDKEGKLLKTMSHTTTPAELVAKIRLML